MSIAHTEAHLESSNKFAPEAPTRFEEGQEHSHLATDSKDQRSIANKLAAEEAKEKADEHAESHKLRPTEVAEAHGNKPSRGARIDQEIEDQERAELERKGKA